MHTPNKASMRARLRASRAALDVSRTRQAGAQLAANVLAWLAVSDGGDATIAGDARGLDGLGSAVEDLAVCAYISVGKEPPTDLLLESLDASGYRVFVPVCEPGFQLGWVRWTRGVGLVKSDLAPVMEPVGRRHSFADLGALRAVIVPALAVDASGSRLGQGGGYYDRFLADTRGASVAAVIYEEEFLVAGAVPADSLDMPVGFAITPSGVHPLSPG